MPALYEGLQQQLNLRSPYSLHIIALVIAN